MGHFVYLLTAQSGSSFVASGSFTSAGGIPANRIARWTGSPCTAPIVTEHPQAETVVVSGETLTLSAKFSSVTVNDAVAWHWHRNAIDITNGAAGASVGGGTVGGAAGSAASPTPTDVTATLTITGVQPSDAGLFTAEITNTCNQVATLAASVSVRPACSADLNGDDFVDDADFSIFAVAYNVLDCADPAMAPGCPSDLNSDSFVDDADFVLFVGAYNDVICP
jgi:hypothetical protein